MHLKVLLRFTQIPFKGASITSKNNPLKIPGSDAFTLSLNEKGKESVMCMASYYSVADKLQTNFGDAFNPLKSEGYECLI